MPAMQADLVPDVTVMISTAYRARGVAQAPHCGTGTASCRSTPRTGARPPARSQRWLVFKCYDSPEAPVKATLPGQCPSEALRAASNSSPGTQPGSSSALASLTPTANPSCAFSIMPSKFQSGWIWSLGW